MPNSCLVSRLPLPTRSLFLRRLLLTTLIPLKLHDWIVGEILALRLVQLLFFLLSLI